MKNCQLYHTAQATHANLLTFTVETSVGARAHVLIDCGSTTNFVSETFVKSNHIATSNTANAQVVKLADGGTTSVNKVAPNVHLYLTGRDFCETLLVFPIDSYDIILGMPWLRRHKPVVDWETGELTFPSITHLRNILLKIQADNTNTTTAATTNIKKRNGNGHAVYRPRLAVANGKARPRCVSPSRAATLSCITHEEPLPTSKHTTVSSTVSPTARCNTCSTVAANKSQSGVLPLHGRSVTAPIELCHISMADMRRSMRKGEQFFLLFVRKRNNGVEIKSANGDNIVKCDNDGVNTAIGCTTNCTATLAVADAHTVYRDDERITAELVNEFDDVFPDDLPCGLPPDRFIKHHIKLEPGAQPTFRNHHRLSPQDMDELRDSCEQIASFLIPDKPDVKDPYWNDRARAMIKVLLMHIVTACPPDEHNFWTLYKMLRVSGDNWLNLVLDMKNSKAADGLVSVAAEEFLGLDPNGSNFTGIRSSAQNATTIFESPQLRRSLEKSDFNPYDLTNGDCTVYVVIPERFLDTHSTWLRLVMGLCLKACNARPNKRVNFLLDEFAIMGKMKDIQRNYAFARGQNIVLWMFAQSLSQIKEIYGEDGMNAFLSNAAVFQCFGVKDQFTKEFVSKALGEETLVKASTSFSSSSSASGDGSSSSTSYSSFGRALLTPEEVEKFPDILCLSEGLKFAIERIAYFQNRFDGKPIDENWTEKDKAQIKAGRLPEDWREIFKDRADPAPRVYA